MRAPLLCAETPAQVSIFIPCPVPVCGEHNDTTLIGARSDAVDLPPATAEHVAEALASLTSAHSRLATTTAQLANAPVNGSTIARLEALLAGLRPAARLRAQLAYTDHYTLLAGASLWVDHHASIGTGGHDEPR